METPNNTNIDNPSRAIAARPARPEHTHRPVGLITQNTVRDFPIIEEEYLAGLFFRHYQTDFLDKKTIYGIANNKFEQVNDCEFAKSHTLSIRHAIRLSTIFAILADKFYNRKPSYIAGVGLTSRAALQFAENNKISNSDSVILTTANVSKLAGELTAWTKDKIKAREPITHQMILGLFEEFEHLLYVRSSSAELNKLAIDLYLPGTICEIKQGGDIDTGKLENTVVKNFLLPYLCLGDPKVVPYYCVFDRTINPEKTLALEKHFSPELTLVESQFFEQLFPTIDYATFMRLWKQRIDQLAGITYCICGHTLQRRWNCCPMCGTSKP
jgi:hypothetical protein